MPIIGQISVGDGATFTPKIENDVLSWTNDKNLPNPESLDIVGATFTPAVSNAGVLSWSNNKGLPNPQTVDMAQAVVDKKPGWGIPIGYEYFTFNPNVPQGSLPLFGGEYSRATYSDLWAWVQEQSGYLKTEADWQDLATANNGNVPYYSSGDGSTTFRVPSLKCWIKGANGTVSEVGSYLAAGLPNITGRTRSVANDVGDGAFRISAEDFATGTYGTSRGILDFNASLSNPIYGNSTTVQPESIVGMWLVKAYGTIVDTGQIDEQQYIDDRIAALPNTFLPLAGGTMSGNIEFNGSNGRKFAIETSNDGQNFNLGWNVLNRDGAFLGLRSSDFTNREGEFYLAVRNSQTEYALKGTSTGDLTWKGYNVATDRIENGTLTAVKGTLAGGTLRKRGGIVELSFELSGIGAGAKAWTTFLNIPNGFRPIEAFDFPMLDNTTGWSVQGKITSSGDVSVWPPSSTIGSVKGHIVYFV